MRILCYSPLDTKLRVFLTKKRLNPGDGFMSEEQELYYQILEVFN